ncbi:MAG: endonuclease/exonuclease/phosphatase family protein [Arcobacteraceae bacterium]
MKNLRVGTFNLFQFVAPPYSWYTPKNSFTKQEWEQKTSWIKKQIVEMNCDIIGFQEVFSKETLEQITKELGFDYFITVDDAKVDDEHPTTFISTTVALASKYPIVDTQIVGIDTQSIFAHDLESIFHFSRTPIKALIELPNKKKISVYVNHFKSNRENELEYTFTKNHTLKQKKEKNKNTLQKNISTSLKQRLCETSSLFHDFKKTLTPIISVCDLNDKEFSLSIDALTNESYHQNNETNSYILFDCYNLVDKKVHNPHPEYKTPKRTPTSYFHGVGNVLDYIFVSKEFDHNQSDAIGRIVSYEVHNNHLNNNPHGSLLESDHAQIVCEIEFK